MIYIIVAVCYSILLLLFNPSGWVQNKIFDKRLSNIKHYCLLLNNDGMLDDITYDRKSCTFNIYVQDEKHDSISVLTAYSSSSVYINGAKVCTMHRLHNAFHINRSVEYSDNHKIGEIDTIIKQASKDAKKRIKVYYAKLSTDKDKNKSLFNK